MKGIYRLGACLTAAGIAGLLVTGTAANAEESSTSPGGMTHPINIANGPVLAIKKYPERLWVRVRTTPEKVVLILIPKWAPIIKNKDKKRISFDDFKKNIRLGDELSIRYSTNISWDWIAVSAVVLKAKIESAPIKAAPPKKKSAKEKLTPKPKQAAKAKPPSAKTTQPVSQAKAAPSPAAVSS